MCISDVQPTQHCNPAAPWSQIQEIPAAGYHSANQWAQSLIQTLPSSLEYQAQLLDTHNQTHLILSLDLEVK